MITVEDMLIDYIYVIDYYTGFGKYTQTDCIIMQVFAETIYTGGEDE